MYFFYLEFCKCVFFFKKFWMYKCKLAKKLSYHKFLLLKLLHYPFKSPPLNQTILKCVDGNDPSICDMVEDDSHINDCFPIHLIVSIILNKQTMRQHAESYNTFTCNTVGDMSKLCKYSNVCLLMPATVVAVMWPISQLWWEFDCIEFRHCICLSDDVGKCLTECEWLRVFHILMWCVEWDTWILMLVLFNKIKLIIKCILCKLTTIVFFISTYGYLLECYSYKVSQTTWLIH